MATNFFGEVHIGTKVTVENGGTYVRTKVESGGVYNEFAEKENDDVENKPKALADNSDADVMRQYIKSVSASFKYQNQWFAIIKPLMWKGIIAEGDYDGAVKYIGNMFPDGLFPKFTADDIKKLDSLSMCKQLDKWDEKNAPISGVRFNSIKLLTETFWNMIQ